MTSPTRPKAAVTSEKEPPVNGLAPRVLTELEGLGLEATPQAFAVWYRHLSGADEGLSAAITAYLTTGIAITDVMIGELHEVYVQNTAAIRVAEQSSRAVMMEIDGIVELIRVSVGSSSHYSSTLSTLLGDMVTVHDPAHLRQIVQTLVIATEETKRINHGLEHGLQTARREVSELRRLLEDAKLETLKDSLTGISNRRHFERELQAAIELATKSRKQIALLMIDIDHFKLFNDTHGHLTGDKVLRVVAQALREKFPNKATVARYGGEEFAVILPDADLMAGWIGAEAARQSILARELVKRSTGERIGRISISAGVASWKRTETAVSLIARADQALLHAKRAGRNRTYTEDQISKSAVA